MMTAAATTGPASGPRPASSMPQTTPSQRALDREIRHPVTPCHWPLCHRPGRRAQAGPRAAGSTSKRTKARTSAIDARRVVIFYFYSNFARMLGRKPRCDRWFSPLAPSLSACRWPLPPRRPMPALRQPRRPKSRPDSETGRQCADHVRAISQHGASRRWSGAAARSTCSFGRRPAAPRKARLEETRAYYKWLADMPEAERDKRFRERFDRIDTNHDGVIDAAERAAWREQQRAYYGGAGRGGSRQPASAPTPDGKSRTGKRTRPLRPPPPDRLAPVCCSFAAETASGAAGAMLSCAHSPWAMRGWPTWPGSRRGRPSAPFRRCRCRSHHLPPSEHGNVGAQAARQRSRRAGRRRDGAEPQRRRARHPVGARPYIARPRRAFRL